MTRLPVYVLITPARNEAEYIEHTIRSVVAQTVLPLRWIIVSDGSTDGTDDIVAKYVSEHPWISLVRMPERSTRHFAGKVLAFNAGYRELTNEPYEIIASVDADISFDQSFCEFLLRKFLEDSDLGLAGTPFVETSGSSYDYRFVNIEHVSGAVQFFRRECFESIGGYTPIKRGAIDHVAVISARMKGWKTRTFVEKQCQHHRPMGSAQGGILSARFKSGIKDYSVGNHPLWELSRSMYQMTKPPYVVGGLALLAGYASAFVRRVERPVSEDLVGFQRTEQMDRLVKLIRRR